LTKEPTARASGEAAGRTRSLIEDVSMSTYKYTSK
jgi:hypothetical protein